jgi:HK97 gp10 family phage protein
VTKETKLEWHGETCYEGIIDRLSENMQGLVDFVELDIRQSMESTPRRPDGRSFPGNPPAVQTGELIDSLRNEVNVTDKHVAGIVGSYDVEYATYLELGTYKMEPRPFMVPAFERIREDIPEILSK